MRTTTAVLILTAAILIAGCKKAPASVESSHSTTPKDAFVALLRAMQKADSQQIFAACKITPEQRPMIEAGSSYTKEVYRFRDQFIAQYGEAAWDVFQDPAHCPGDHDCTFIILTDAAIEKASKSEIVVDGDLATCNMPMGEGKVKLKKNPDGTWLADGSMFVPPDKNPADLIKALDGLTSIVKKYEKAIGKPNITASDIDYEIGRSVDELLGGEKDKARHRFDIDTL